MVVSTGWVKKDLDSEARDDWAGVSTGRSSSEQVKTGAMSGLPKTSMAQGKLTNNACEQKRGSKTSHERKSSNS